MSLQLIDSEDSREGDGIGHPDFERGKVLICLAHS